MYARTVQEFGPLLLNDRSYDANYSATGVPTPQRNPWSWTNHHTVCALDSPPPIGMSFCSVGPDEVRAKPWLETTHHPVSKNFILKNDIAVLSI